MVATRSNGSTNGRQAVWIEKVPSQGTTSRACGMARRWPYCFESGAWFRGLLPQRPRGTTMSFFALDGPSKGVWLSLCHKGGKATFPSYCLHNHEHNHNSWSSPWVVGAHAFLPYTLESLWGFIGALDKEPQAPLWVVVPLTTRQSGCGPWQGFPNKEVWSKFLLMSYYVRLVLKGLYHEYK